MKCKFRFLLLLIVFCFSYSYGQENEAALKDRRITIQMEKQALGDVFKYLMTNYDVPIGFEESTLDRDHNDFAFETNAPVVAVKDMESTDGSVKINVQTWRVFKPKSHWITVSVENGSLEAVLNLIVGQMENYKWEINQGVVNIFPAKGRDARFEKLLALKIKSFTFEKDRTVRTITSNIIALPEFKVYLTENKLYFTGIRAGSVLLNNAQYGRKLPVGMNFTDLSLRELLNKITIVKRGGWILKWKSINRAGEEHIDLDI